MQNDYKRLVEVSWKILECKVSYYRPELLKRPNQHIVSDEEYDKLESEYRELCQKLGVMPSAADMVGVDLEKPSVKLTVRKLNRKKGKK